MGVETVLIPAAASAIGAGAKMIGANKAAGAAKDAHAQNLALFHEMFGKAEGYLNPYIGRGNTAGDAYMSLLGYGDPKAAESGFNKYLDSTGYKFQMKQGVDALNTSAANQRLLNSGANLKHISNYGQEMGRQYFNSYLGLLARPQEFGVQGASALANAAYSFGKLGADNNDTLAGAKAGAWQSGTNALADGLTNIANLDWSKLNKKGPYGPPA